MFDSFSGPELLRQELQLRGHARLICRQPSSAPTDRWRRIFLQTCEKLAKLDPPWWRPARPPLQKMRYQLDRLYAQAACSRIAKREVVADTPKCSTRLFIQQDGLQERAIGGVYYPSSLRN